MLFYYTTLIIVFVNLKIKKEMDCDGHNYDS